MFSVTSNKMPKEELKDSCNFLMKQKSGSRLFGDWLTQQFHNVRCLGQPLQNIFGFPLVVAKWLSPWHSHQITLKAGWMRSIRDLLSCIHSYEGEKFFPEAPQCPVAFFLYPSCPNWDTCLSLNPAGKVGNGISMGDLDQDSAHFFFFFLGKVPCSTYFRLCV